VICWYLAAVVHIQLCKHYIESGEAVMEAAVWEEINVLRFAMLLYGSRSPIGVRQEKLLQGLMTEIVRMSERAPLPLYPYMRDEPFPANLPQLSAGVGAPLPNDPCFETMQTIPTPTSRIECFPAPTMLLQATSAWPSRQMSGAITDAYLPDGEINRAYQSATTAYIG